MRPDTHSAGEPVNIKTLTFLIIFVVGGWIAVRMTANYQTMKQFVACSGEPALQAPMKAAKTEAEQQAVKAAITACISQKLAWPGTVYFNPTAFQKDIKIGTDQPSH